MNHKYVKIRYLVLIFSLYGFGLLIGTFAQDKQQADLSVDAARPYPLVRPESLLTFPNEIYSFYPDNIYANPTLLNDFLNKLAAIPRVKPIGAWLGRWPEVGLFFGAGLVFDTRHNSIGDTVLNAMVDHGLEPHLLVLGTFASNAPCNLRTWTFYAKSSANYFDWEGCQIFSDPLRMMYPSDINLLPDRQNANIPLSHHPSSTFSALTHYRDYVQQQVSRVTPQGNLYSRFLRMESDQREWDIHPGLLGWDQGGNCNPDIAYDMITRSIPVMASDGEYTAVNLQKSFWTAGKAGNPNALIGNSAIFLPDFAFTNNYSELHPNIKTFLENRFGLTKAMGIWAHYNQHWTPVVRRVLQYSDWIKIHNPLAAYSILSCYGGRFTAQQMVDTLNWLGNLIRQQNPGKYLIYQMDPGIFRINDDPSTAITDILRNVTENPPDEWDIYADRKIDGISSNGILTYDPASGQFVYTSVGQALMNWP